MVVPHLDSEYPEIQQSSPNGEHSRDDFILTYLKKRFERLYNRTQPRRAMERAKRDFELQREEERTLEIEDSLTK